MLSTLQRQLEAVYRVDAPDVRRFLIGREELETALGRAPRGADEWVLMREHEDGGLDLAVYIAPEHREALSGRSHPGMALEACFRAFCAAVEGISHFLMLIERARRAEPISLLELETQAEVDKFVCAYLHHPRRAPEWRARLFRDARLHEGMTAAERERYREAGRLARAYSVHLDTLPHTGARLDALRGFWRAPGSRRMAGLRRLAG